MEKSTINAGYSNKPRFEPTNMDGFLEGRCVPSNIAAMFRGIF
jgi:hypothetical protein